MAASGDTDTSTTSLPSKSLLGSSLVVSAMTMLSRVLGLVRDVFFARFIGAEAGADAFFVAFKIPNFFRRLFAEGAFAQAFVPVLSEYRQAGVHSAVRELIDRVSAALGLSLLLLTGLAILGAPIVAMIFAPGFMSDPAKHTLTAELIRITFPYLFLISMSGLAGAVLNSYDRFAVPAVTPVLLNVVLITAAVWVSPQFDQPVFALAWGVLIAGVVQLLFQLPFLARLHLLPAPKLDLQHSGVRKVLVLMVPALFGVSVSQINLLLDTVLASLLPSGSVSWLYYSDRLAELPLGVFGVAIATVILPNLSRQHAGQSEERFNVTINWALRLIVLISLPATIALFILAEPILATLFYYGKTTAGDIAMSTLSLKAYAVGLTGMMLIKVLASGFYARQDMKTPVRIAIVAMAINMVLNITFVAPLYFWFDIGHVGLALATAVSSSLNAWLLFRGLLAQGALALVAGWSKWLLRLGVANSVMAAVLVWGVVLLPSWLEQPFDLRVGALFAVCLAGLFVYVVVLAALGVRPRDLKVDSVSLS